MVSEMRTIPIPSLTPRQLNKFWAKVDKSNQDGCWLWTGWTTHEGYGKVKLRYVQYIAHRVSFTIAYGPIPYGLTVDHVKDRGCTNRNCVNPAHLEAVPIAVNVMRGDGHCARNVQKTHCPQGHEYSLENTFVTSNGWRQCRACRRNAALNVRAA